MRITKTGSWGQYIDNLIKHYDTGEDSWVLYEMIKEEVVATVVMGDEENKSKVYEQVIAIVCDKLEI